MATAWALLVVSSGAQADTLRHQRQWAEQAAADNGWRLARTIEGVSSGKDGPRKLARDVLVEVRATVPEARPEHLLMIRMDRIGRGSIVDSQIFVRDLLGLGVRLFTRDAGEVRLDSAMDELIAAVQVAVARHENDVRSEKLRAVYRRRRAAGQLVNNRVAYGLEVTPERQIAAQKTHVKTIRRVFEMRIAGVKVADIARWLSECAPPHVYKTAPSYPVCWSDSRVARLIQNKTYIGTIVDEETWLKAQRVANYMARAPRQARIHGEFPLASALRCVCGRGISADISNVERNKSRGIGPNLYYICKAGWNHGGRWPHHRAKDVEEEFIAFLGLISIAPAEHVQRRALAEATATAAKLDVILERLRKKHDQIEVKRARVWHLDDLGHLEPHDLAARLETLNEEKARLEDAIVRAIEERTLVQRSTERNAEIENLFRTCLAEFADGTTARKQELSRMVASSFGGLRLSIDGHLLVGQGVDNTPNRRLKLGQAWRADVAAWPPKSLNVRELAALKKLPTEALAAALEISLHGLHAILVQRRRPRGWRLNKLRAFASAVPPGVRRKDVSLDALPEVKSAALALIARTRGRKTRAMTPR